MRSISLFHPRCTTFYVIIKEGSDGCSLTMVSEKDDTVLNVGSAHCVGYTAELTRLRDLGYMLR